MPKLRLKIAENGRNLKNLHLNQICNRTEELILAKANMTRIQEQ